MENNNNTVLRINKRCIESLEHIRKKVEEQLHIKLNLLECSEILGEKYFRGQLGVIPFEEIKKKYGNKTGWIKGNL